MKCPKINSLILSDESRKAIEEIKKTPGMANEFALALSIGKFVNIFAAATPAPVTINSIDKSDWHGFIDAMSSIPHFARARIEKIAYQQWINAQYNNNIVEAQFWEAVTNGCKLR